MEQSKVTKTDIDVQQKEVIELDKKRNGKLNLIGNIVHENVPVFADEANNEVVRTWGVKSDLKVDGKTLGKLHHHEVMNLLDILDLERGTKVAGHRGYFLKGDGVFLNQALIMFGLNTLNALGYTPIQPPFFMKS
jgi:seryl-tRNA synthetase